MITRRKTLALLSATAIAPYLSAFDVAAAPLTYTLKPVLLDAGVWMIVGVPEAITRGNGGAIANITIIATSEGAVIIDTGPSRRYGEELTALAQQLTGKPVVRVYLTHFHPDHVLGNNAFDANIIAAQAGVISGLQKMGNDFASAMYNIAGDWMRGTEVVLPKRVVTEGVEQIGDRRFRLIDLKGHTPSDLAVLDETSGILITGDLVFLDRAPTTPHANLEAWRQSLDRLGEIAHNRLMPGHGPAEPGQRGIKQTRDWLAFAEESIRDAFERGLDMTEAMAVPLPEWTSLIALAHYEYERTVMHLYPKLEAALLPRVGKRSL